MEKQNAQLGSGEVLASNGRGAEVLNARYDTEALASLLADFGPYTRWVGGLGYDTRPYHSFGCLPLPVAHTVGVDDGRPEETVAQGDLVAALETVEYEVVLPLFYGCECREYVVFARCGHDTETGAVLWRPTYYGLEDEGEAALDGAVDSLLAACAAKKHR